MSAVTPVSGPTVCVTGASGFIASWLVASLLDRGHRVRGTVRSAARAAHLLRQPGAGARLTLIDADLTEAGSFADAVAGCDVVFHTASPYRLDVGDPVRDLVQPAVHGTVSVLAACARVDTVRRVVLTSSMAAVTDQPDGRVLTDADWNTQSSLTRNPYYYSKTMAERAAWEFMARERPRFDLVVVNPFVVMGPSLGPEVNASNQVLVDLVTGVYPAILSLSWGIVDVRDVAEAHVRAAEVPTAAGRYLCAQDAVTMRQVVEWLRDAGFGVGTKLPTRRLDFWLGNVLVMLDSYRRPPGAGSYLRTHIGRTPRYDTSRVRQELGVALRPVRQTVLETMADLVRWGHVGPAATRRGTL